MLFYITVGAPQAVPGTACVEANRTACTEDYCSSGDSKGELTHDHSSTSSGEPVCMNSPNVGVHVMCKADQR
jgi:hypothetical protein